MTGTLHFDAPVPCPNPPETPCEDLRSGTDSESSLHSTSRAINSFKPPKSSASTTITVNSQLGERKHREVRCFVQGHTASEESQDLNLDGARVSAVILATVVLLECPECKRHVDRDPSSLCPSPSPRRLPPLQEAPLKHL